MSKICPNCNQDIYKMDYHDECDNNCGTFICKCGCEFFVNNENIIVYGHNTSCGIDIVIPDVAKF